MSAAASATRASSIRKNPFCRGLRESSIVRCAGSPAATRASTATCRRAITPPMPSLRSTRTVISSRFASGPSPISAPMSRPSVLRSRARSIRRCWPACIRPRPSPSNAPASSPTPCRPTPIAAPAGRKPVTCWSGLPTVPRKRLASTAPKSAAAISFRSRRCPTRLRSGRPTTAAISRACLRACCRQAMSTALPRAAKPRKRAACCAASALRVLWNPPVSRHRALPATWARGSASTNPPRYRWSRTAPCARASARIITDRAIRRASRKFFRRSSASRSTRSR